MEHIGLQFERGNPSRDTELGAADHYAAVVLHDLHNPLDAAMNLAYLIDAEAEEPESVRRYVRLLREQLSTVSAIARDGLGFYKQSRKPLDLVPVAEAALRIHEAKIREKGLHLVTRLPGNAFADAHAGEMLQVLSNLLANAIDALPSGGMLVLRVTKCPDKVHVTVADDGHGIPAAILRQVFEPFFTTKNDLGTGLGLAISKSIVKKHGGTIRARSSTGPGHIGTVFRISLPA